MGTIASVLQWTCTNCNLINPTECLKCLKCGNVRKIFTSPSPSSDRSVETNSGGGGGCLPSPPGSSSGIDGNSSEAAANRDGSITRHQTLPGYVEISSEGNESRRVYKTLLRGCLKRTNRHPHIPSCSNCEDTRKYIKSSIVLFRHFSNPSLNRRWICQECELEINSVTWHCLNCDTVSYLAPIYKETLLHRKQQHPQQQQQQQQQPQQQQQQSQQQQQFNQQHQQKSFEGDLRDKNERKNQARLLRRTRSLSMDSGSCRNLTKRCHICLVNCNNIFNNSNCKHHDFRLPAVTNVEKVNYTNHVAERNRDGELLGKNNNTGLINSYQRINKSLSSISDPFFGEDDQNFQQQHHHQYSRQSSFPEANAKHFKTCVQQQCEICGICNRNLENSNFTITTLSRAPQYNSNRSSKLNATLPRNGGVLIAVKDWSNSGSRMSTAAVAAAEDESYYESLRGNSFQPQMLPNSGRPAGAISVNAHFYENHSIIRRRQESPKAQSEPIYAVVNKLNKSRNKIKPQPEPKYSYIGMSDPKTKQQDTLYASIGSTGNNNKFPAIENMGNIKTSHITSSGGVTTDDKNESESSIYAKVWKGPRKAVDTKTYVHSNLDLFVACCIS